jgi:hypothetical protein
MHRLAACRMTHCGCNSNASTTCTGDLGIGANVMVGSTLEAFYGRGNHLDDCHCCCHRGKHVYRHQENA